MRQEAVQTREEPVKSFCCSSSITPFLLLPLITTPNSKSPAGDPWGTESSHIPNITVLFLGGSTASGVSEPNGPLVEILSVLKAMNFVFTENPLQAVVPRTLGMTQLWDIHMALSLFS